MRNFVQFCLFLALSQRQIGAYLVVLTPNDEPGGVIFDAGLRQSSPDASRRHYDINVEKSAAFVRRLLHVERRTGRVVLRRQLSCSGIDYPDMFTLYIDSTANSTLEYASVPLRIVIKGCGELVSFEGKDYLPAKIFGFENHKILV